MATPWDDGRHRRVTAIAAAVGAGAAVLAASASALIGVYSVRQSDGRELASARREAWATYLGTLDELDRIQPGLSTWSNESTNLNQNNLERFKLAYPDSKRQAARVRILVDDDTAEQVKALQGQLSQISTSIDQGERSDVGDISVDVGKLFETAQNEVGQ